jgi:hypothetical protein
MHFGVGYSIGLVFHLKYSLTNIHNFVQNFKSCVKKHLSIIISVAYVVSSSVNPLQNRETQHVNIVLQYVSIF